jgi:hypothetical protein
MFKSILKNNEEITDFIVCYASAPVDEKVILEYFNGCKAILKTVEVSCLIQNNLNSNIKNSKNEKHFQSLPFATLPPLVVENNLVLDGNHRLRILKKK